jgi:hypothetical protein
MGEYGETGARFSISASRTPSGLLRSLLTPCHGMHCPEPNAVHTGLYSHGHARLPLIPASISQCALPFRFLTIDSSAPTGYSKSHASPYLQSTTHPACVHRVQGVSSLDSLHTITIAESKLKSCQNYPCLIIQCPNLFS